MSKYTEAIESLQWVDQYEISYEMMQTITEALKIADRLEQADAEDNKIIYDKCCKRCIEHDNCAYLHRSLICETVRDFFEGYQRAIADIGGDTE